jgi:hypothetical protein
LRSSNGPPTGPEYWLLVRGTGARPLPQLVGGDRLLAHSSSRRPAIQRGDLAICYAAVWQTIFAVVEIVGEPEHDPERPRWSWRFPLRPLVWLDDLDEAPPVEAAGVFPQSLGRHSYIRLSRDRFEAGRAAIEAAAARLLAERTR